MTRESLSYRSLYCHPFHRRSHWHLHQFEPPNHQARPFPSNREQFPLSQKLFSQTREQALPKTALVRLKHWEVMLTEHRAPEQQEALLRALPCQVLVVQQPAVLSCLVALHVLFARAVLEERQQQVP
jgi:hypothetical protein